MWSMFEILSGEPLLDDEALLWVSMRFYVNVRLRFVEGDK